MQQYFIISLKHSTPDELVFWRADDAGYTTNPFLAGIYPQDRILSDITYYTENSVPVPVQDFKQAGVKVIVSQTAVLAFRKQWLAKQTVKS